MAALTIRTALRGACVILLVLLAIFIVGYVIGDPARLAVPITASNEQYEQMRASLGLDDPLATQLWRFVEGVFTLDLGESYWQRRPALDVALSYLPATLLLVGGSFVVALLGGGILGVTAALRRGTFADRLIGWLNAGMAAAPPFWIGIVLILLLAVEFDVFPTSGNDSLSAMVLPVFTLSLASIGRIAQTVRGNLLAEEDLPYARMARAKGFSRTEVVSEHTSRNAGVAVTTYSLWELIRLLTGASVVVEVVFAWPGVGQLAIEAVAHQDFPLIQACVVVVAVLVVFINFAAELLYGWLDPRLRPQQHVEVT